MLEETSGLLLHQLSHHVAENGSNSIKALVSGANIVEPVVVEKDFLNDENGNRLAELRACLHYPETEWDDLSGKEEVNHLA